MASDGITFLAPTAPREAVLEAELASEVSPSDAATNDVDDPSVFQSFGLTGALRNNASLIGQAPGIEVILEQGRLLVGESGSQLSFRVRLQAQPSQPVVVRLSATPSSEASLNIERLVFDVTNWSQYQTASITGQPDLIDDGDQLVSVDIAVDPGASAQEFRGINIQMYVVNLDVPVDKFLISLDSSSLLVSDAASARRLARFPSAGSAPMPIELGSLDDTVRVPSLAGQTRPVDLRTAGGNDVIEAADWTLGRLDGGDGTDTLRFVGANSELDFSRLPDGVLKRIEVVDFSGVPGLSAVNLDYPELIRQFPSNGSLQVRLGANTTARFGNRWNVAAPILSDGEVRHVLQQGDFRLEIVDPSAFTNPVNRFDVDHNGIVSPLDVLLLVNAINVTGGSKLNYPRSNAELPTIYVDSNKDGFLSAIDALLVVNHLNSLLNSPRSAEGEAIGEIAIDESGELSGAAALASVSAALVDDVLYDGSWLEEYSRKCREFLGDRVFQQ